DAGVRPSAGTHPLGRARRDRTAVLGDRGGSVESDPDRGGLAGSRGALMQDRPTLRELLDAAEDFLRTDLRPQLEGAAQFHTLVTANVLAIVKRELDGWETFNRAEAERLRALLGGGAGESLRELNVELCRRIRAGEIAIERPE